MISADKLIKSLIDAASMYPEAMQERMNTLFQNSGTTYIIILASINIILNILIIYFALSNKLITKKTGVIVCSILSLLTASFSIIELLAIINIIVMAATKRDKVDFDQKKEMPVLKKEKVDKKKIILAIILFVVYFSQFLLKRIVPNNEKIQVIVSIIFYLTMTVLVIIFFYDLLSECFRVFRKNFKVYISNLIGKVGKFYLIYFVIAFITAILSKVDTSVNQKNVEALPILMLIPLATIYAPLVEETLFRGCIRRFIKNDKLFIIISGISFGLIHTIFTEPNLYNALVLGLPYMAMGGFLAYLYVKTNNICTNMAFHAFHNTLAVIISILIKGI